METRSERPRSPEIPDNSSPPPFCSRYLSELTSSLKTFTAHLNSVLLPLPCSRSFPALSARALRRALARAFVSATSDSPQSCPTTPRSSTVFSGGGHNALKKKKFHNTQARSTANRREASGNAGGRNAHAPERLKGTEGSESRFFLRGKKTRGVSSRSSGACLERSQSDGGGLQLMLMRDVVSNIWQPGQDEEQRGQRSPQQLVETDGLLVHAATAELCSSRCWHSSRTPQTSLNLRDNVQSCT